MKNATLIIFWILSSFIAVAQNQSIESSNNNVKKTFQDTDQIDGWNKIAIDFLQNNQFDSSFRYAKKAMDASEKSQYKHGLVYAYHSVAAYNFHIKEYKIGKFFLLKSLNAAILEKDKKAIIGDYKELTDLYKLQGNFKLATESNSKFVLYRDSLKLEDSLKHAAELKIIYNAKEKEKAALAANDAKASAANEAKKQQIFYISLIVLLFLSVLIIWLLVSRSKLKKRKEAELLAANAEVQQDVLSKNMDERNNVDTEKKIFLQKIAEKELSAININIEKKSSTSIDEKSAVLHEDETTKHSNEKKIAEEKMPEELPVIVKEKEIKPVLEGIDTTEKNINGVDISASEQTILSREYSYLIALDQLQSFTAKLTDDKVKLFWKIADVSDISSFEIQKSMDNVQFITIETIDNKGFKTDEFEIFDLQPLPGLNYYRLEIIDKEGNFIYGPIVDIEVLPATTLELVAYPTRVKDVVMITASGGKMPVLVNVFNKIGKKEFTIEVPPITTPVYLNNLVAGTYTLQMKCQGKTVLQQLVKIS